MDYTKKEREKSCTSMLELEIFGQFDIRVQYAGLNVPQFNLGSEQFF